MKYGLIGYPIAHSLSPALFRAAYPDSPEMTYDLIEESDFERAYARFLKDYEAVNVTTPYKDEAFRKVNVADTIARELYAVNILKKKDGKIYGYNSDFWALQKMLAPYATKEPRFRWPTAISARPGSSASTVAA